MRTKLDDWEVPMQIGDQKGAIAGTLTWVPLDEGSLPLGAIIAFAGARDRARRWPCSSCAAARTAAREEVVEAW